MNASLTLYLLDHPETFSCTVSLILFSFLTNKNVVPGQVFRKKSALLPKNIGNDFTPFLNEIEDYPLKIKKTGDINTE